MHTINSATPPQHFNGGEYFFRKDGQLDCVLDTFNSGEADVEEGSRGGILCKACRGMIAQGNDRFAKDGYDEHCFFNPHGMAFRVTCFYRALGCVVRGEPSAEFSWFRGCFWQLAFCRHCHEHLGWFFRDRDGEGFFCLILLKLIGVNNIDKE